jgi:hypothetical protein
LSNSSIVNAIFQSSRTYASRNQANFVLLSSRAAPSSAWAMKPNTISVNEPLEYKNSDLRKSAKLTQVAGSVGIRLSLQEKPANGGALQLVAKLLPNRSAMSSKAMIKTPSTR